MFFTPLTTIRPWSLGTALGALLVTFATGQEVSEASRQAGSKQPAPGTRLERVELLPHHLEGPTREIAAYERVSLALPSTIDQPFELQFDYQGEPLSMQLRKHSVRSADFRVWAHREDGTYERVIPGEVRTFRGTISEAKGAVVCGALLDTGMEASVLLPDGRSLGIVPDFEAFAWGDRSAYRVFDYRDAPLLNPLRDCTTPPRDPHRPPTAEGGSGCAGLCRAELALDLDFLFHERYGTLIAAVDAAENIVNWVNVVFERDVEIRHDLTEIIVRTSLASEPPGYNTTSSFALLNAMEDEWEFNQQGVVRDVAHLLSGRLSGGRASSIGGICSTSTGYSVAGTQMPFLVWSADVTAHELGHNWDAVHLCCPQANCSNCPVFCDEYFTMNPCAPPLSGRFKGDPTILDIVTHKSTRDCLEPVTPNDNFEDAQPICPGDVITPFTIRATNDGSASCGNSSSTPDVWYVYTPAFDGIMTVDTCSPVTNYDTVLSVHGSTGFLLGELACNDDTVGCGSDLQSSITLGVVGGDAYWIRVSGWNGSTGSAQLTLNGPPCETPFNDDWQSAFDIGPGDYFGTTRSASPDGTPSCTSSSADVWFYYEPTNAVTQPGLNEEVVVLELCDSTYDTVLSVHNADHPQPNSSAAVLFCNDDFCDLQSRLEWMPQPGISYLIRVGGWDGNTGSFRLSLSGPDSDNEEYPGFDVDLGTTYLAMEGASVVSSSASCAPLSTPFVDRWYRYTPPVAGTVIATTCGTNDWLGPDIGNDTVVSIHPSAGSEIACDDDTSGCGESGIARDSIVTAEVGAFSSASIRIQPAIPFRGREPVQLNVDFVPANDSCANAQDLPVGSFAVGLLTDSTNTDGSAFCGISDFSPSVWYRTTAPADGLLVVDTCGTHDLDGIDTGVDTVLSLHSGCPGTTANQLDCNDDSNSCFDQGLVRDSAVSTQVTGGQTVWIRASNFNDGPRGEIRVHVDLVPTNDECSGAVTITDGQYQGTLSGATADGNSTCGTIGMADVWYRYVAECTGDLLVETCGSAGSGKFALDTVLSVHLGCPGNISNQIACNDDACGNGGLDSRVSVTVLAGQAYYIRVAGNSGLPFDLNVSCQAPAPPNDDCANAQTVFSGSFQRVMTGATPDGSSTCSGAGQPDIWFRTVVQCTGRLELRTCGTSDGLGGGVDSGFGTSLSVHTGCPGNLSNQIACSNDDTEDRCAALDQGLQEDAWLGINVVAGQIYWIRVASTDPEPQGLVNFSLTCAPKPGATFCFCDSGAPCGNLDASAGCSNSTGAGSFLDGFGSASISADDASLTATGLPSFQSTLIFGATAFQTVPFGDGILCGAGDFFRFPIQQASATGSFSQGNLASLGGYSVGQTIYFQAWYRDPFGPCGNVFNTSSGYRITFLP